MSEHPAKTPSRRLLLLAGTAALIIAGAIAAKGILDRAAADRQLAQWTAREASPTVQLASLQRGGATQELALPGNIQPFMKAPIFARVAGYVKSWQEDIGAKVKAGQLLASIDTPELHRQLEQAKANLETAEANEKLPAVTAQRC